MVGSIVFSPLQSLSAEQQQKFASAGRVVEFPNDTPILNLGQEQDQLFYLLNGRVGVVNIHGGRMYDVAHIDEGRFFGEIGFFTGHTSTVSLKASVPCKVWTISRTEFDKFLDQHPTESRHILGALLDSVCNQLCFAYEKMGAASVPKKPL